MIFSCTNKSILSVTLLKEFKQIFYFGLKSIGIYSHTIWIPILERSHFPKSPPRCPSVCLVLFVMTPQKTSNRIVHLNAAKNTDFYGVRHHLTLQKCLSPCHLYSGHQKYEIKRSPPILFKPKYPV